jgi:DNA repair exonuclease SbcCD nuclease subunit
MFAAKARKYDADGILIDGDLFDKARLDPVTLAETTLAVEATAKVCPVFVVPGNHDASSVKGGRYNVEALAAIDGVEVVRNGLIASLSTPSIKFYGCPYSAIDVNKDDVEIMRSGLDPDDHNVLFFHNSVVGCRHLAWVCDDGVGAEELCEGWDDVISGHFHTKQKFGGCGRYLGAPMQHNFSDVGERRGFYVVTFDRGAKTRFKFVDTKLPTFHDVEWGDVNVEGTPDGVVEGDYVRVTVEATSGEWSMIRPELEAIFETWSLAGINGVPRFKPVYHHETRGVDVDSIVGASVEELSERYVKSNDVVIGDLDEPTLIKMGKLIMSEARSRDD